jgi:predicted pyridoxine 5'-phosphate oxidase superfamily flavin-nucleotide-binding protein
MPADQESRGERVILFTVAAWDANCPKHIPQRFEAADVARTLEERDQRIAELEQEVAWLKGKQSGAAVAA